MRQFEPQDTSEPYCDVVSHDEHCDCGVDPDAAYESQKEKEAFDA